MPRGDFTGPWGQGPMTGRGAGFCAGYPVPGHANPQGGRRGFGRGFGRGLGWGFRGGWGRGWGCHQPMWGGAGWMNPGYPPSSPYGGVGFYEPDPKLEAKALQETAEMLESELKQIKQRLKELEDTDRE